MWVKIDDGFYDNGKVIAVGRDARALYLAALCYANKNATHGFVPEYMIAQLAAKAEADKPQQAIERLCTVFAPNRSSLWTRTDGGFTIHDYHEYQLPPKRVVEISEARSEAGSKGGKKSASARAAAKQAQEDTQANPSKNEANDEANASESPSKPEAIFQQNGNPVSRIPYPESPDPYPATTTPPTSPPLGAAHEPPEVVVALVKRLSDLGVTELVAADLARRRTPEQIEKQIEYLHWRVEGRKDTPKPVRDPAALLVASIEDSYAPPDGYVQARQRESEKERVRVRQKESDERADAVRLAASAGAARMQSAWCGLAPVDRDALTAVITGEFTRLHKEHAKKHAGKLADDPESMPFGIGRLWRDMRDQQLIEKGYVECTS